MKIAIIILLALLPSLLAQEAGPLILYVSGSPTTQVSPAYSSLRGGALIYLQVIGHDPMASGNMVYVGNFPCIIPSDGVTDTFISCETTDSGSDTSIYSLPVTLISYGVAYTTASPNVVHYTTSSTPQLVEMFPSSGFANQMISYYGVHQITDLGDGRFMGSVVKMKLGSDLCSRFDVVQDPITATSNQYIQCIESSLQVAGKYNVSEQVTPGFANHSPNLRKASLIQGEYFEFTALPTVAAVSPSTGDLGGQIVTISGTGFANVNENNTVTVDGNNCAVTASTQQQITCTVAARNTSLTSLLTTNSTSQLNGYISGAGLRYSRFSFKTTMSLSPFVAAVRGNNATFLGTPQETGFRSELKEGDLYGSNYGQSWSGYFTAPVAGVYTFRGTADDQFAFYISNVTGSAQLPLNNTPLIYADTYQINWNNFYIDDSSYAEATLSLAAGQSYYIEAYHINNVGGGYFKIDADVPNSDTTLPFQAYEIDKITTNSTIQPEVVTYTMTAGTPGTINLKLVRTDKSGTITYNVNTTIAYGCTDAVFQSALNNFNSFNGYEFTVVRTIYDASNNVINTTTGASKIVYTVSFLLLRSVDYSNEDFRYTFTNYTGNVTKTPVTTHSPLISGTFNLVIAGYQFNNIPFNASASTIQTYIRNITGFEKVHVDQASQFGAGYWNTWIISYIGVNGPVSSSSVIGGGLSGGSSTPSIQMVVRRPFSTSITFDPIDYRFLNTYNEQINVLVRSNMIPAICTGSCGYRFVDISRITAISRSGSVLSLTITSNTTIGLGSISVQVQGLPCAINPSSTLAALTCNLTTNSDGSPILVAGTFIPAVYVNPSGYSLLDPSITALAAPLNTDSLSVTSNGNNGGYYNTLTGSGFPLDKSKISITVCNNIATIVSSNNQKVKFFMPACSTTGSQNVNVNVGSLSNSSLTFTYTDGQSQAPVITSISPATRNPAIKGLLTINGTGFGVNSTAVSVYLSNSTGKIYQLNVLKAQDTYLQVGLPGGLPGPFTVQVTLPNSVGDSVATAGADQFQYLFSITSVTPNTGSYNGGTLLTITGTNFSPATADTLVYIGDTLNWFCNIETITATQITCRTPAIHKDYKVGEVQRVVISTKLYMLNSCPLNNCNFSYVDAASSPKLTTISASTAGAINVTVNGTSFISVSNCSISLTSQGDSTVVFPVNASLCTSTGAKFAVPTSIPSGNYFVKVRNEIGESNGLALKVKWVAGTPSYNNGGSVAGNVITFTGGSGYPATLGNGYNVLVKIGLSNVAVNIISCCVNNQLVLGLPHAPTGTTFSINFIGPVTTYSINYITQSALTPNITVSSSGSTPGNTTVTLTRTDALPVPISSINIISTIDKTSIIPVANFTNSSTTYTFAVNLNSGSYAVQALTSNGYCLASGVINIALSTATGASIISSFAGGIFTITGNNLSPSSYITVNNFRGSIQTYSSSSVIYNIPPFVTAASQAAFNLQKVGLIDGSTFVLSSDQPANVTNVTAAFDGLVNTVYGSPQQVCWIGIDVGQGLQAAVNRFRFFPLISWANTVNYTLGAVFEGSNDQSTWTSMGSVDQTAHSGWNVITSKVSTPFRYFRLRHTNQSQCNIAEIQVFGIVYSSQNISTTSQLSDVVYNDGFNSKAFTGVIEFRGNYTPTVQSVVPPYGDIFGGYSLTLKGTNLGFAPAVILIDQIPCAVTNASSTQIVCTVGQRPKVPSSNSFTVTIGGSNAIIINNFLYVLRWSDSRTWGVDLPPIDGDLVYVPPGMTLLVDQNTPVLTGIAVEDGGLIFPNDTDVTVRTGFITLNGGIFIAGTESAPLYSKLTFIMYGGYYGKQQVMFGNKGIGCLNCKFSMYGKPRTPTWTTIASTIYPGNSTFTVSEDVDWQIGETIVVASTSFFHYEAEQRVITAISNRTITVDTAFVNKHVSVIENYGTSDFLEMRAEVGLLTRNIKMMGDPTSDVGKYGSHLMLTGSDMDGFEGHVAYSEFTHCGQPQILGRYCIHFHMAGEVPTSFVRGNAVHESFARVVTIHGVYHLTVEYNVGYRVRGHNFFIEDGIETHNTIRYNLAISSLTVTNMLQTDISVASFWVTNPTNDFYGNHAAGGDFYGIWYEIKTNPDGPSATNDVCPIGNPLGLVTNNVAHSNIRFGLRIFKLYARKFPCLDIRDDSNGSDPWFSNPSSPSIFSNFTIYKNLEDGVLSEQTGNVIFRDFIIAQNYKAGVEFYLANFTKEMVSVDNCVIIGQSQTNMASDTTNYTSGMAAVITPRTGQSNITNTRFYNYPVGSIAIITCSHCDEKKLFTNRGTEIFIKNLTLEGVNGNYLYMMGLKRDVIYDLDASLAMPFDGNLNSRTSATIISNFNHIANYNQQHCKSSDTPQQWDNAIVCDQTINIRRIYFTNLLDPYVFNAQYMKAMPLFTVGDIVAADASANLYTSITSRFEEMEPKVEKPHTWSLPFITGQIYQIWWGTGMDFSHLAISSTTLFTPNDPGVIFKFNYTLNRQLYHVGAMRGGVELSSANYFVQDVNASNLAISTCYNGEYYHNNENSSARMLTICQSGKEKQPFEYTEVNAVICLYHCPAPAGTFTKENFTRRWSNATQWPNGVVPAATENVTVNGNWTVLLDIDPAPANYLIIDGTLIADDTRDVNITARSIFIRAGNVTAGSPSTPFQHKFTIQVSNSKQDHGWYIDPLVAGNKYIVVTGSLNLYGIAPSSVQTTLTQSVFVGGTSIFVDNSSGWQIGDTLALSPSYGKYNEYESVNITALNNDGSISVSPALKYNHYGSNSTISSPYGSIDVNTHVGHLNRNIRIVPGPDYGWGVNILVYGFLDGDIRRVGSVNLNAVNIQDGGQYDTTASALQFLNVVNGNYSSTITATSFVNCKAWCVNINNINVKNITFTNNVFYNGWVFGVQAVSITNFQFTNNLFIGIVERPTMNFGNELVACFGTYEYINAVTSGVAIKNNFCLGSQGHGFAFPHILCSELETNPFAGNTAGSCQIGFIFNNIPAADNCKAFSYINAYANQIGQICAPISTTQLVFKNFVMVDNQRGATLKFGNGQGTSNHTGIFSNSYISAISRPDCGYCYGSNSISCSGNIGLRLLSASANGESLPAKFGPGFDVVCKQQLYESKVYMSNVTFDSFNQTYLGAISSQCGGNFVFRENGGASDSTADTNLFNVQCTNCDKNSYLLADENNPSQISWFGGCGDILCTGRSNFLIIDWNGTFLGFVGTIIPNNTVIGSNQPGCTFNSYMNSYICTRSDFAVLAYQSIAADFNTRIMWPVSITGDGANYTTVTNGWREWDWMGKEPLNRRFGRFLSVVKLNSTYNLTYAAMPPIDMQFQLQKRTPMGNPTNFIIAKQYYPMPNMIQVLVNGVVQDPILITDSGLKRRLNTTVCGDNVYFYTNYTTHFVVTQDINCLVEVSLTNTVQLTTHFALSVDDFFKNGVQTTFIANLCALLGITDTSRVKVVGVVSGSAVVTTNIVDSPSSNSSNGSSGNSSEPTLQQVQDQFTSNNGAISSSLGAALNTTVLSMGSTYYSITPSSTTSSSSNVGLIVGVSIAGCVLLITVVLVFFYCLRKRAKIVEEIRQSEEEIHHEKDIEKDSHDILGHESANFDAHHDSHTSEFKLKQSEGIKLKGGHQEIMDE